MFTPYPRNLVPSQARTDDPSDIRVGNFVQWLDLGGQKDLDAALNKIGDEDFVLLGYPDDRGVTRNGGRSGAKLGPDAIRRRLYSMTPAFGAKNEEITLWDLGNFNAASLDLVAAHNQARQVMARIRGTGARVITLGGGHDWAFPDFADFAQDLPGPCHIINLDAHLDMRPIPEDPQLDGHSGTPFRKVLVENKEAPHIGVVGLQRHCNAPTHLEWAKNYPVHALFLEDFPLDAEAQWKHMLDGLQLNSGVRSVGLSVDLDAFPRAYAPGVSAPQAFGLDPRLAQRFIREWAGKIRHLGIYELAPPLDHDEATARLAAKLIHDYLYT